MLKCHISPCFTTTALGLAVYCIAIYITTIFGIAISGKASCCVSFIAYFDLLRGIIESFISLI